MKKKRFFIICAASEKFGNNRNNDSDIYIINTGLLLEFKSELWYICEKTESGYYKKIGIAPWLEMKQEGSKMISII